MPYSRRVVLKHEEILPREETMRYDERITGCLQLCGHLFGGNPVLGRWSVGGVRLEIHDHNSAVGPQRFTQSGEVRCAVGDMVIDVDDQNKVDRLRKIGGIGAG